MRQNIYVLYDLKSEAPIGSVVQLLATDAQASRMFGQIIASPDTLPHQHPEDFVLLNLGVLDFDTMTVTPSLTPKVPITTGESIVRALSRARQESPTT